MSTTAEAHKEVVRSYYAKLWNDQNFDLVSEILAADITFAGLTDLSRLQTCSEVLWVTPNKSFDKSSFRRPSTEFYYRLNAGENARFFPLIAERSDARFGTFDEMRHFT